jgi:hypothetical protein
MGPEETVVKQQGQLRNSEGELIAEGLCELNAERHEVTMWPERELSALARHRGALTLRLEDGVTLEISDRHMIFKLGRPGDGRTSIYRLRLLEQQPLYGFPTPIR